MPTIRDDAICIRHWDWSETSQTVALFTRGHGVIRALAKGSKREKSAFSGGIELLTGGEMIAIVKANTSLATLTSWDLTRPFGGFRRDLLAFHAGMFCADLVHAMVQDQDPHPVLFGAMESAFEAMTSDGAPLGSGLIGPLLGVVWSAIVEGGIRPELGEPGEFEGDVRGFRMDRGGVCADPGQTDAGVLRVRASTIELLREIDGGVDRAGETSWAERVGEDVGVRALRLLVVYVRERTGIGLDAFEALDRRLDGRLNRGHRDGV